MPKIPVSISQLAKYGLDYVSLISSGGSRSRPVKTDKLDKELLPVPEIVFKNEVETVSIELTTTLDSQFDPDLPDEEKSDEQQKAESLVLRDREILNKIQEIDTKIKTDEYTKRVVLQTGFVSFEAKRFLESEYSEDYETYEGPLLQLPVASISFKYSAVGVNVIIGLPDNYVEILSGPLKNYLPQQYYDEIFTFIANGEADGKTTLPLDEGFLEELWAVVRTQLDRADAKSISSTPSFDESIIAITNKTNHFLAEDLKAIAELDDEELLETSLGSWVSDDDMTIEQAVSDDGSTEIFFPFDYDKFQLKVLGITANKAVIVEGPPGTGKSQTISNLLIHLAATGKRVLFASQKDQAIRGVKDKLKSLDVPFLFGYIPDKSSKLYTEDDEKDSAANTLIALNREFQKGKVGDLKEPLELLTERSNIFTENIENERSVYALYEGRRSLSYVESFYEYGVTREWFSQIVELEKSIATTEINVNEFEKGHDKFVKAARTKFKDLEIDYQATVDAIGEIKEYFKANIPERAGWIGGKVNDTKLRNALKKFGRNILQEIYIELEKILFSDKTKSARLQMLEGMEDYFVYASEVEILEQTRSTLNEILQSKNVPTTVLANLPH